MLLFALFALNGLVVWLLCWVLVILLFLVCVGGLGVCDFGLFVLLCLDCLLLGLLFVWFVSCGLIVWFVGGLVCCWFVLLVCDFRVDDGFVVLRIA